MPTPHKCVVYCCYSVVQSVLLFHCPVYCVVLLCSLFCSCIISQSIALLLSSLLCYSGVQFIVFSSLLGYTIVHSTAWLFYCLVYGAVLLSGLLRYATEQSLVLFSLFYCPVYSTFSIAWSIECFHMTSRRPYWCPKTMEWRPSCWCAKPVLWELSSFLYANAFFCSDKFV